MQAQSRDQLLSILWSEVSAAKAAGNSGTGSAAAGSPHASPSGLLSVGASGLSALLEAEAGMDWADPTAQDRLLKAVTTVRVQVGTGTCLPVGRSAQLEKWRIGGTLALPQSPHACLPRTRRAPDLAHAQLRHPCRAALNGCAVRARVERGKHSPSICFLFTTVTWNNRLVVSYRTHARSWASSRRRRRRCVPAAP